MEKGYVESALPLVLFVGVTGSGKTLFKRLLLGQSVPKFSPSTPLTEPAVRTTGNEEWKVVRPEEMMDMVADAVKGKVSLLDSTWEESGDIAFTGPQEHSEHPETTLTPLLEQVKQDSDPVVHGKNSTHSYKKTIQDILREIKVDSNLLERIKDPPKDVVGKLMDVDLLYLLDSGGQPPFREMLPHFVQKAAVTVLMVKLNERLDYYPAISYRENVKEDKGYKSELTHEQILYQYIQAVQSHKSRVFVVGTHMDKEHRCRDETREMKNKKLLEAFKPVIEKQLLEYYRLGDPDQPIFPVNCTSRRQRVREVAQELRTKVMKYCKANKKTPIPLSFFMLDYLLKDVSKRIGVDVLSIEECYRAAEEKLFMPRKVCELALKRLGELNVILYYPNILPQVVFPEPKDILNMITELVRCSHKLRTSNQDSSSTPLCCMHPRTSSEDSVSILLHCKQSEVLLFRNYAQVNDQFLEQAFPSHYREGLFNAADFLELLKGLLIAVKLERGIYFIPSLLPDLPKEKVSTHRVTSSDHPAPLVIHYPNMWLPVGVMPSLVVYLRHDCKWRDASPPCLYHNCIKFRLPEDEPGSIVLIDSTKFLEVHVKSELDSNLCHTIREDIMAGLEKAHESLHYDPPQVDIGFICPREQCKEKDGPHHATMNKNKTKWTCSENTEEGGPLTKRECVWLEHSKDTKEGNFISQ